MNDNNVRQAKTEPTSIPEMSKAVHDFLTSAELEGTNLRMEYAKVLTGQRVTLFFNYDDMG